MFIVMFEFVVKDGYREQFLEAWPKTTQGIYLFKGSLGSRLHIDKSGAFIAYAQWPDETTYRAANDIEMSAEYEEYRTKMRDSLNLESTKILYEMEVEVDYLHRRVFDV
ncbi:antibiotic biosynthesis monooxygenase [Alteromonas sp. ALT199]|uniref:antibiotic biosynthesis monooxygenase family protein n=1 Tax=unclassified Alteromonas TaxID=2614992 RepID=UPI001BE64DB3|nr:antibiotic biosynthesis monooxygenase [Alteromonas sp. ALT199]MBT3136378.1 antibiotic biosynthesis monooxygenase [Alteromonas sp. ALT199]